MKAELVTDLISEAFIACLRRFVSTRGLPKLIWSDNGLQADYTFLEREPTQRSVSDYLTRQHIEWKFIPQHAPHFGGLWEAAVKSIKTHLRKILGDTKLTYEEMSTVLQQIESCLNSRPLAALDDDDDGLEALTPGHFLIGRPLQALPDALCTTDRSLSRWQLTPSLARHFWKRWSAEYLTQLNKLINGDILQETSW